MKLNVGCGARPLDDWINVDKHPVSDAVVFGDIESGLEYSVGTFDEILLDNVIEHVDDIPKVMREIERLLCVEGEAQLITPHFSSSASWRDPTHKYHLSFFSFDHLAKETTRHYFGVKQLALVSRELSFSGGLIGLIARLLFKVSPKAWEDKWCFLLRGSTLRFKFKKLASC